MYTVRHYFGQVIHKKKSNIIILLNGVHLNHKKIVSKKFRDSHGE